ncbi:MAG: hypothetical protein V8R91_06945 [Butyricimonas faecihominis]
MEQDLERDNYIYIRDINDVTNESLKNIMQVMGVNCAIFLPLYISSHLFSFLCLSRCHHEEPWSGDEIAFFVQVALPCYPERSKKVDFKKIGETSCLVSGLYRNRVDYILRLNRHLHVCFSNKTFYSLFGDSPDDIIGSRIGDLMTEMDISSKKLEEVVKFPRIC